ncbi:MAG: hypothetical protein V1769_03460 [Thermoplasmatota archaeon]
MVLTCLFIFLDCLVRHLRDAVSAVPRLAPCLVMSGYCEVVGRLQHTAVRTGVHLAVPGAFDSFFTSSMQVFLLAFQTLPVVAVASRRGLSKIGDGFGSTAMSASFLGQGVRHPVEVNPTVMAVDVVSSFLKKPTIKLCERFDRLASFTS